MPIYTGVNGTNREVKKMYTGVSGTNRELKEMYTGVNGTNRKVFQNAEPILFYRNFQAIRPFAGFTQFTNNYTDGGVFASYQTLSDYSSGENVRALHISKMTSGSYSGYYSTIENISAYRKVRIKSLSAYTGNKRVRLFFFPSADRKVTEFTSYIQYDFTITIPLVSTYHDVTIDLSTATKTVVGNAFETGYVLLTGQEFIQYYGLVDFELLP